MYIRGPGLPANVTRYHPTNHLDITATIVDLAGAHPHGPPLDGLSFAGALTATPVAPTAWRNFSASEYFGGNNTWVKIRRPLEGTEGAGVSYHLWCAGPANEVFDFASDPWELTNLAATPAGQQTIARELPLAVAHSLCSGADCSALTPAKVPPTPLACYNPTEIDAKAAYFDP